MGVGKSTIGRRLASRTGGRFVDLDAEIERRTGASVDLIFEIEGESGFRKREQKMLHELTSMEGIVLATGGGAVLDPANRKRLKDSGTVVYLIAAPEVLAARTERDKKRPLLRTGDRLARIQELIEEREQFYLELADCVIDTSNCTIRQAADEICGRLELKCVR